ncbi:MAG: TraB/GumN family protein [Ferruginibacter sp.]
MKIIYFFNLLVCLGSVSAQTPAQNLKTNADGNTLLWEISGNGITKPSYLFGTFHLLCKEDIHFSNACKQAIANSHEIYLELDMDDPATVFGAIKLMSMKDKRKLKDLYTPEAYERVVSFFKDSMQTSIGMFQNMKPFFLVALLYPKMMPCDAISGVEQEIMSIAKENDKEIKGLETMAFQAAVFDSIPYEKQAEELLHAIDSMDNSKKYFALMNQAYKEQDMKEIEKLVFDKEFGMEGNQEILLDGRNKNWVSQLKPIMKDNTVFVAVGTGHLVGENGLINLLRKEGYTVRPLENK